MPPPEGRKIAIRRLTAIDIGLLLAQQQAGGVNVSMLAMGDGIQVQASADRRQPLPPTTAVGAAAPEATPAPQGCGSVLLDSGMSVVR